MEAQRLPCPPVSLDDQPVQLSCLQAIPAASSLSLSPVILQPEQAHSQTIYLKALTIPLFQPIQSECLQPNSRLPMGQTRLNLESTNMPLILSPLLPSEGTDQPQALAQKPPRAINIINGLPILPQSSPCGALGSPGKSKSAGKYLCKHCGRDCLKPSVLEKHMRSHTGERPFPCTTCGIAFKTQSNLYKHRRTQTHVNNAKLPSESDSRSPLEENEKVTECIGSPQMAKDRNCDHTRAVTKQAISESTGVVTSEKHPLESSLPTGNVFALVSESQWMTSDSSCYGGVNQSVLEKEAVKDPANPLQRRKVQEERSPTVSRHSQLQRQQATFSDKLWDSRSADYKLKKCESTDSGYLSRSDSVEQPMLSPSPLHSLCEHSTESEGEAIISNLMCMTSSSSKADLPEKATGALALEKKKLEEHISKLISHNKVVVDDSQLDNVRPRKTVLSKQGSIDLPMPYTYKDSFHFDIRPLDSHRKKNLSLCSAKSTFTPVEKHKPLFFHSVPTQFSTTIDCVPVTRSNSLPFVDSTRRMQDQMDSSKLSCISRTPPSTSGSGLLPSDNFAAGVTDFPNSHPRALVRQVAVDDLPLSHMTESPPSVEEVRGLKKSGSGGEGANPKGKKPSQRKLKMFSQEKWQVYGDETFKKIYQKMKSNQTAKKKKGNKIQDLSSVHSDTKEPVSHEGITVPKDGNSSTNKTLVPSPVAIFTKPNTKGSVGHSISSPISQSASSQESSGSFAELMETSHSVSSCEHGRVTQVLLEHRCCELHASRQELKGNFQMLPLRAGCELTLQLHETKEQENSTPLNAASLQSCEHGLEEKYMQGGCIKCVPLPEDISTSKEEDDPTGKESSQFSQVALPLHPCNAGELVQESQKLPSERKKLKVDELKNKENVVLRISLGPSNSADRVVKLPDHCQATNIVAPVSKSHTVKGEKQTAVAGMNVSGRSIECTDAVQHLPVTSSNRDDIAELIDTADISALSFSEQLRAEVTKEYICSSYPLQELIEKPCSMITGTGKSSQSGDMGPTPSSIQHLKLNPVTPHLEKNEFLPKYILRHPQGRNSTGMSLAAGEQENMPCISLPTPSTDSTSPARNDRLHGTNSADVFLCPLQLELSHLTRAEELKWDVSTTWKSLVVCSPAILETTSITTRVDWRCPHQWPKKKIKKDTRKGANDSDNLGDPKPAWEQDGGAALCPSHTPGKKICFTSMYTGGILISSDMTGQSSALQLLHSGNSSIISVSSLVERTTLCRNADKPLKERELDASSFPRLQDAPACSADTSRCLCHSSDMLYCHVLCCPQKGVRTLSQLTMASCSGNSKAPSLSISFPTLNAEPQLTWCCLTRNLPLPVEQKEKKDSAYFPLHTCKNEHAISKGSLSLCQMKNTRQAAGEGMTAGTSITSISFSQRQQMEKQHFSIARSDGLLENISDPEKAKEKLCKTRQLTTHKAKRSRKRKKVKINQKRYISVAGLGGEIPLQPMSSLGHHSFDNKNSLSHRDEQVKDYKYKGSYGYRHILLKTNRLNKQHWPANRGLETRRKHHPHPYTPDSHEHCRKCLCLPTASQGNYPHLQQEASCTAVDDKAASPVKKNWTKEDAPIPTNEHSCGSFSHQSIATVMDIPTATRSCALASNVLAQKVNSLDLCSLKIIRKEPLKDVDSDHPWPSSGTCDYDAGKIHPCHSMGSEVTNSISVESKAVCRNLLHTDSKCQNVAVSEPSVYITGKKEQPMDGDLYPCLKEQLSSTFQTPCPISLRTKLLTKASVSSNSLPGSRHIEQTSSSPACLGCTVKNNSSMQPYDRQGKSCKTGLPILESPSAHFVSSRIPSKSYKKQNLEMLNKQTHVEYDDTSSDDEDRLIIEI